MNSCILIIIHSKANKKESLPEFWAALILSMNQMVLSDPTTDNEIRRLAGSQVVLDEITEIFKLGLDATAWPEYEKKEKKGRYLIISL